MKYYCGSLHKYENVHDPFHIVSVVMNCLFLFESCIHIRWQMRWRGFKTGRVRQGVKGQVIHFNYVSRQKQASTFSYFIGGTSEEVQAGRKLKPTRLTNKTLRFQEKRCCEFPSLHYSPGVLKLLAMKNQIWPRMQIQHLSKLVYKTGKNVQNMSTAMHTKLPSLPTAQKQNQEMSSYLQPKLHSNRNQDGVSWKLWALYRSWQLKRVTYTSYWT